MAVSPTPSSLVAHCIVSSLTHTCPVGVFLSTSSCGCGCVSFPRMCEEFCVLPLLEWSVVVCGGLQCCVSWWWVLTTRLCGAVCSVSQQTQDSGSGRLGPPVENHR